MKINEIILKVLDNTQTPGGNKFTQVMMCHLLTAKTGKTVTPAALSDRFKNENMKINTVIEMLDVLGYDVVVVPREKNREKYVVESGEKRVRK